MENLAFGQLFNLHAEVQIVVQICKVVIIQTYFNARAVIVNISKYDLTL